MTRHAQHWTALRKFIEELRDVVVEFDATRGAVPLALNAVLEEMDRLSRQRRTPTRRPR